MIFNLSETVLEVTNGYTVIATGCFLGTSVSEVNSETKTKIVVNPGDTVYFGGSSMISGLNYSQLFSRTGSITTTTVSGRVKSFIMPNSDVMIVTPESVSYIDVSDKITITSENTQIGAIHAFFSSTSSLQGISYLSISFEFDAGGEIPDFILDVTEFPPSADQSGVCMILFDDYGLPMDSIVYDRYSASFTGSSVEGQYVFYNTCYASVCYAPDV